MLEKVSYLIDLLLGGDITKERCVDAQHLTEERANEIGLERNLDVDGTGQR